MLTTAAFLSLALKCAATVHPDTAQDVARIESGFNPLAIGVVGGKSIYPATLGDALQHVSRLKAKGKNFSLGLMQINQANFKKFNVTPEQVFDPCKNISIFEKLITDCFLRGGTLQRALSCYYSGNFNTGLKPEAEFSKTSYVERIGYTRNSVQSYVVPSTKAERGEKQGEYVSSKDADMPSPEKTPTPGKPRMVWPKNVVRGALMQSSPSVLSSAIIYPANVIRGQLENNVISKEINREKE